MREARRTVAALCVLTAVAGLGLYRFGVERRGEGLLAEEAEEKSGRPPVEGDYWLVRLAYGGDAQRLRFEPAWLIDAARQNQRIASATPAGRKTYRRTAGAEPALDPNAFTLLGPKPLVGEGFGSGSNAGRTNVIVTDPTDPAVAWLGSDGGGVWKTTNCCSAATTWEVKTDFPEVASLAIGDLALDPRNPDVLYAGTGDLRYGSFSFGAAGILKSVDKGETWTLLGADVFNPYYGPSIGNFPQYQSIGKVVVDPNDSDNVVVGAKTGLYFSYDGGVNWTGPCRTNAFAAATPPQRQDTTGLLAVDRGGTTVLYAAVGTRGQPTPVQPDLVNNGANGVYRTTMPSGGCPAVSDWTLLANGFPSGTGSGVPNTSRGRLEIAVAPSAPLTLYAMFANPANSGIAGIWKTTDGGDTWVQTGRPADPGTQMWYDAGIKVSPTDPDTLFVNTVDLFRSTDGGGNWTNLTGAYSGGPVHPDNHATAFVGGSAGKLLNGNDGGVYSLDNALTATGYQDAAWTSLNDSLPTIEVYHGDITANFANSANAGVSAGFQDNGSATAVFPGTPSASPWNATFGADGIVSRIEPVLGQRWYYSSQNGYVALSTNGPDEPEVSVTGGWTSDTRSFLFPFDIYRYGALDVPGSGCTGSTGCTHLIGGSNRVWETTTGGIGSGSWSAKTDSLVKGNLNDRSFINNLHYAVSDPTVAIVGTNDGNVQYVFGLGVPGTATAVNVTGGNAVLPNRPVMDVATDPANPLIGYAALGGFAANTPATPGHVMQVTCTAQCASFTWIDKSGNLPDIPANAVIVNPHLPNQVFVGMDWGLYYTDDIAAATPTWQRFEGLPHVMVWSFAIDRGFTTLAAFTRSRGAWAWPLPTAPIGDDQADLAVMLTPPPGVEPGMPLGYAITVTNHGPATATNVRLTSSLPTGLAFKANSGDCAGPFPCVFPDLAPGETRTVTTQACVARNDLGATTTFSANVTSDTSDPDASNDSSSGSASLIPVLFADGFDC